MPNAEIAAIVDAAPGQLRDVVRILCAQITDLHPDATMLAWPKQRILSYGFGPRKMSEHYAYIGVHARHVNLGFYYGAALPDPDALLEGTGKNLRHIKLRDVASATSPPVRRLLKHAMRDLRARSGGPTRH